MITRLLSRFGFEKRANGDPYWENYAALRTGRVESLRPADAPWPARAVKDQRDAQIHALGGETRPR